MSKRAGILTISLSVEDQDLLTDLAAQFGCLWGDRPSVTDLIRKVARREIALGGEAPILRSEILTLRRAIALLESTLDSLEK